MCKSTAVSETFSHFLTHPTGTGTVVTFNTATHSSVLHLHKGSADTSKPEQNNIRAEHIVQRSTAPFLSRLCSGVRERKEKQVQCFFPFVPSEMSVWGVADLSLPFVWLDSVQRLPLPNGASNTRNTSQRKRRSNLSKLNRLPYLKWRALPTDTGA